MTTSSEPVTSSVSANGPLGRELLSVVDERHRLRQREEAVLIAHPHRSRVGEGPRGRSCRQRRPADRDLAAVFEQRQVAGRGDGAAGLVGGGLEPEPVVGVGDRRLQAGDRPALRRSRAWRRSSRRRSAARNSRLGTWASNAALSVRASNVSSTAMPEKTAVPFDAEIGAIAGDGALDQHPPVEHPADERPDVGEPGERRGVGEVRLPAHRPAPGGRSLSR